MAEKKSILEEALLELDVINKALNANTKEMLRSVAREEINSVVKESLLNEEEGYEEEDLDSNDGSVDLGGDANAATADITGGLGDDESNVDGLDNIEGTEEVAPEVEPDLGMDADALETEPMDMTAASDDDVLAIYKKLSGEDEIEIVGDDIHLNISEPGEYVIKTNGVSTNDETPELGSDDTTDLVPATDDDSDVDYEIEMGDDDLTDSDESSSDDTEGLVPADEEGEDSEEEKEEEKAPVAVNETKIITPKTNNSEKLVLEAQEKYKAILAESKKLKAENEEFRKALKEFRTKLVETVVFNSNLTYTTRLFMEHATTKAEKENIFKRFDTEVSNLLESKKLYKTIVNELASRKPINEAIENKLTKEVNTSTSKQLNENTIYVDPSTKRILDLMQRVEKK